MALPHPPARLQFRDPAAASMPDIPSLAGAQCPSPRLPLLPVPPLRTWGPAPLQAAMPMASSQASETLRPPWQTHQGTQRSSDAWESWPASSPVHAEACAKAPSPCPLFEAIGILEAAFGGPQTAAATPSSRRRAAHPAQS